MKRIVTVLMWAALAVAVLAYPAAFAVDRVAGKDVILLAGEAYDAGQVKQRRAEYDDSIKDKDERRKAIVEIYGPSTKAEVLRVLFVDDAALIHPAEDPTLSLLPTRKDGSHRIQAASAYFAAKIATIGGVLAFLGLAVARRFVK